MKIDEHVETLGVRYAQMNGLKPDAIKSDAMYCRSSVITLEIRSRCFRD